LLCAALSPERLARSLVRIGVSKTGFTGFSTPITQQDRTRNRNDNSACNLAILRHMALNLPQRDRPWVSLRSKFYLAARKDDFLAQLLFANLKKAA
jgi:hypothetical protein